MVGLIRHVIGCVVVLVATQASAAPPKPKPAPAPGSVAEAEAVVRKAEELVHKGESAAALALIKDNLASMPKDAERQLLLLMGNVLLNQRDIDGALDAYQAYLDTGVHGTNAIEVQKIIVKLKLAPPVDIAVSNGPAEIYLDAKSLGVFCPATAACTKKIMPGPHRVIVERAGFVAKTERITLQGGKPAKLAITLVEQPSQLTVNVVPAGAQITIDDAPYTAPVEVPAGDHRIVAGLDHYVEAHVDTSAHEGKPVTIDVALVPLVAVHVEPATADLALDGKPVTPEAGRLPVSPGPHHLTARAPGHQARTVDIPAELPADYQISIALAREVVEQPVHWFTTRRKFAAGAGVIAIAGVTAGAILGLQAKNADHDAGALCPSPTTPCRDAAKADALNQHGRDRATQANIAFGVAGAGAIAAAVLWMVGAPESHVVVAPRVGGNVAALDLSLRF
jgi:hypothetical protein